MLLDSNEEREFEKIANLYSNDILDFAEFPNDYCDFLVDILSDKRIYTKTGAHYFLALLGADTDIMSGEQLKSISQVITENFAYYVDEMLCLTSCDFIARYYQKDYAESILNQLKRIEEKKSEKGFADDGLRILRNERD